MTGPISVREASRLLGVHESRIRALIDQGVLAARKLGRDLVLERGDVVAYDTRRRGPGRPLPAASAWGVLALLCGDEPRWVPRSSLHRLRARAADPEWLVRAIATSEPRAEIHEWQLLPSDVRALLADRPGVLTGTSAAPRYTTLVPSQRLEYDAYVDGRTLGRLVRRFRPVDGSPRSKRNAIFRVPTHEWILEWEPSAPPPVVAADLLDDPSERVRRMGQELLLRLGGPDARGS